MKLLVWYGVMREGGSIKRMADPYHIQEGRKGRLRWQPVWLFPHTNPLLSVP